MSNSKPCSCQTCAGAACKCGCQNVKADVKKKGCSCGESCACGPACKCQRS